MQRTFRSFIKNGKERKEWNVLLKRTDAQPCLLLPVSFGKTIIIPLCTVILLLTFYAMQLGHSSPFWVQGICPPIPPDVPLVIWHVGDGFFKQNTSQQPYVSYSCIYCLFFREYFGNQAGLTNCSGILIWLTGSTHRALAAPTSGQTRFHFSELASNNFSLELFYHLMLHDIFLNIQ